MTHFTMSYRLTSGVFLTFRRVSLVFYPLSLRNGRPRRGRGEFAGQEGLIALREEMHGGYPRDAGGASGATRPGGSSMTSLAALSSSMRARGSRGRAPRADLQVVLPRSAAVVASGRWARRDRVWCNQFRQPHDSGRALRHVAGEHLLEDAKLFYRFEVDERAKEAGDSQSPCPQDQRKFRSRCRRRGCQMRGRTSEHAQL